MNLTRMLVGGLIALLSVISAQAQYAEKYRPQFHFTPRSGWMGDPDGLVRYQDQYHLFWWGHAVSSDLVRWKQLAWPMKGDDRSFNYYTGSVVLDAHNSSGLGTEAAPAMVAVYTAHDRSNGLETQRISSSTDYETFEYYPGNPVLDINSRSFRDPDVFWYAPTKQWIMLVALPDDRTFTFYASPDLKAWRHLSDFGPVGAREGAWEVPNLFQIPVNGDPAQMKWVLMCSMGPNKVQYFVGTFDGKRFTLDPKVDAWLSTGKGLEGDVLNGFYGTAGSDWTATGTAFGDGPTRGTLPSQQPVSGYLGHTYGNSYHGGDAAEGTLTSPPFTITRNCINFLIGGGSHPGKVCINLLIDGRVVRTATGRDREILKWAGWDVSEWKGQEAQIEIVDRKKGSWGHIMIDQIMQSDVLMNVDREHAYWIDWGPDFYAARAFRDYDHPDAAPVWLAWMGNWDYAQHIPTSWGRGAQSLPRTLELMPAPNGYRVVQRPWPGLKQLRGPLTEVAEQTLQGVTPLDVFQPIHNTYELEAVFDITAEDLNVGLNLCAGDANKVVLGYDATTSNVYLDRRAAGDVSFSRAFPVIATAPLLERGDTVQFHVFVDQSSIEVFVNDGQIVMTSLIFPNPEHRDIELFSLGGETTLRSLKAWELSSIWR